MPITLSTDLVRLLNQHRLLDPAQLAKLSSAPRKVPDARVLAGELLKRGWLTAFQANQLLQGKANDLVLGSYVLLEKIGEGGMGAVFKARHQTLGRIVALKLIRPERLSNADAVRRFHREIRAAGQLRHPNIVHAFDADEVNGAHILVMEYVEDGVDLARIVKEDGPLPIADACSYMRQAALGLQHAFERGLVHRDIKPHNLLVTRSEGREARSEGREVSKSNPSELASCPSPLIKILDMGLARLGSADDEGGTTTLTQEGAVMGTLDYIAPEQALDSHKVDIRADLYSLGCTFYFLLAGRVPFPGGEALAKLLKHRTEEPEPVERLRPETPPAVAAIVRKLMAKEPSDRFQTPAELAQALENVSMDRGESSTAETVAFAGRRPARPDNVFADLASTANDTVAEPSPRPPRPVTASRPAWLWFAGVVGLLLVMVVLVLVLRRVGPEPGTGPKAKLATDKKSAATESPPPKLQATDATRAFFNGKDLTGWLSTGGVWKIKDGMLIGSSVPDGLEKNCYLYSTREFRDFELRFQVRLTGGFPQANSGVQIRSTIENNMARGAQADMGGSYWGSLYGENLAGIMKQADIAAVSKVLKRDDFNDFSIRCVGKHVTIKFNSLTTVDDDFLEMADKGIIAWQLHAGAAMEVAVKEMSFEELRSEAGTPPR